MMVVPTLNVAGLAMNLVGVILLFRYGMPYRVRTGGDQATWRIDRVDEKIVREEHRYAMLGNLGLGLIVLGTFAQIVAAILP
jgi:hypothetical protein